MKRTLVERVAALMFKDHGHGCMYDYHAVIQRDWRRRASYIIAMVRRHDSRKGATK